MTYFYPLSPNYKTCWPISIPTYSQGQVSVADFSNWSSTGIAASSFLQWCGQNACLDTQNVFSLIFHIVLHQVHWHLFCHLLYYLCAKNNKFGTCRLSARDDNLGVLLSGPPCICRRQLVKSEDFMKMPRHSVACRQRLKSANKYATYSKWLKILGISCNARQRPGKFWNLAKIVWSTAVV